MHRDQQERRRGQQLLLQIRYCLITPGAPDWRLLYTNACWGIVPGRIERYLGAPTKRRHRGAIGIKADWRNPPALARVIILADFRAPESALPNVMQRRKLRLDSESSLHAVEGVVADRAQRLEATDQLDAAGLRVPTYQHVVPHRQDSDLHADLAGLMIEQYHPGHCTKRHV